MPLRFVIALLCQLCLLCGPGLRAAADEAEGAVLRGFFEGIDAGAPPMVEGRYLYEAELLATIYRDRDHRPLWTGSGTLAGQRQALIAAIDASRGHGFNGAHYHLSTLQRLDAEGGHDLAFELLASDALLRQVRHRTSGVLAPGSLDPEWHLTPPEADPRSLLEHAEAGEPVARLLEALWPRNGEYQALVAARARILGLGEDRMVRIPPGPLLRPGDSGPRVLALQERLLGPGDHQARFDASLRASVIAFQRAAGLNADGIVGEATLEVMNADRASWIDRLDANLERWRWLPARLPDTYVRVNVAAFQLRVIQRGEDALRMDVIVGRPYRRTPVFSESIKYLVVNPYWYVPFRLAVQDKLPVLRTDPASLAQQGFEARRTDESAFAPVDAIDWSGVQRTSFHYALRQRPGPANALGQIKFMLPNPFDVYLHDTPVRDLFAQAERGFSSGCVRLSRPLELADWVLRNDGQAAAADRLGDTVQRGETVSVYLAKPLPTYLVYFTAFTDDAGEVVFRRDLYRRDGAIVTALRTPVEA